MHNYFIDSGTSSNVMPYFVCQNINVVPTKCTTRIIQFNISDVKVMGEMKDVMVSLN
jgi:hypothetical protein